MTMNSEFLLIALRLVLGFAAIGGILIGFIGFRHFLHRIEEDFSNDTSTRDQQMSLPQLEIKRRV